MLGKWKSLTTCPAWQVSSENYVGACILTADAAVAALSHVVPGVAHVCGEGARTEVQVQAMAIQ